MTLRRGGRPDLLAGTPRREGSPPGTRRHPLPSEAFADMPPPSTMRPSRGSHAGAPGSCPPPCPICLTEMRASVPCVSRWSASWHTDQDRVPENQACRVSFVPPLSKLSLTTRLVTWHQQVSLQRTRSTPAGGQASRPRPCCAPAGELPRAAHPGHEGCGAAT